MELAVDIFNYILFAIQVGVSITWTLLIRSMWISFRDSPYLDKFTIRSNQKPKVSIILPARNEEKFIEKCLDSLLKQDYENYEIIAIDDRSEDKTGQIIYNFAKKDSRVVHVSAQPKPEDWMGKNWACFEGFKKSTGELLLFTDADTKHSKNIISLSVSHLLSENLDALTAMPKMLCLDFWTKVTLPMLSTFLHTRFSALRVNDPSKKTGYFFGSFFIIKRGIYESVGTHEGVKGELVEDGALGKKVKESGFKMKMVRGEHLVEAVWARDLPTLWHALKRLVIPLYLQNKKIAVGIFFAVLFLLFMPFPILAYSAALTISGISFSLLFSISTITAVLIYFAAILESKKGLGLTIVHALLGPIGSLMVVLGFASGILQVKSKRALLWRGRSYTMSNQIQNAINV
jgi:cellulose synthase/poly-beta-1,6-N-acetylglucosamine synthase-like glycosyltransferase